MPVFYAIVVLLFGGYGVYSLWKDPSDITAVHFLLIAAYFYVVLFEFLGKPLARNIYLFLVVLLIANGLIQLFFTQTNLFSAMVSLLFAHFSWRSYQRLKENTP